MFDQVLQDWTKNFLENINQKDLPKDTYLGGGTAIALQIGHRKSVYLDFFTPVEFVETQWQQSLEEKFGFKLKQRDKNTLIGTVKKVKLSLMRYKYKTIAKSEKYNNMPVASLPDLAAMKLDTLLARGTKRDFIDIYFLSQEYSLEKIFDFCNQKFGNLNERKLMIKKGLIYFNDADKEYMPDMLVPVDWKEIKEWFVKQLKRL